MPKNDKDRLVVVGDRKDAEPERFDHVRTISPNADIYDQTWPSGFHRQTMQSTKQAEAAATRKGLSIGRKKPVPGKERYERNPHEPIKIP